MADAATLYVRMIGVAIRSQLQYRVSFSLDVVGAFLTAFLDFFAVLIIFHNTPRLGTFSVQEVSFLYGASAISFALADLAVGHLDSFPVQIRSGTFDQILLRPRGSLLQVVAGDFELRRLGKALQGAIVLGWAIAALDIPWDAGRVAMLLVMVVAGTAIFCAIWVFMICIVFWAVEGRETANAFTYGGQFLTQYPIEVYGAWLRRLLAYVIPAAFVCYFPSLYILDKRDPLGLPSWLAFVSPVVCVAAAAVAGAMWRFAVRHYRSTGS